MNFSKQLFFAIIVTVKSAAVTVDETKSSFVMSNLDDKNATMTANIILSFDGPVTLTDELTIKVTPDHEGAFAGDKNSKLLTAGSSDSSDAFDTTIDNDTDVKITFKKKIDATESIAIFATVKISNVLTGLKGVEVTVNDNTAVPIPFSADSSEQKAFDSGRAVVKSKIGLLTSANYLWKDIIVSEFQGALALIQGTFTSMGISAFVKSAYFEVVAFLKLAYDETINFFVSASETISDFFIKTENNPESDPSNGH